MRHTCALIAVNFFVRIGDENSLACVLLVSECGKPVEVSPCGGILGGHDYQPFNNSGVITVVDSALAQELHAAGHGHVLIGAVGSLR
eukprot:3285124-Amphidinium_carterae.1